MMWVAAPAPSSRTSPVRTTIGAVISNVPAGIRTTPPAAGRASIAAWRSNRELESAAPSTPHKSTNARSGREIIIEDGVGKNADQDQGSAQVGRKRVHDIKFSRQHETVAESMQPLPLVALRVSRRGDGSSLRSAVP